MFQVFQRDNFEVDEATMIERPTAGLLSHAKKQYDHVVHFRRES